MTLDRIASEADRQITTLRKTVETQRDALTARATPLVDQLRQQSDALVATQEAAAPSLLATLLAGTALTAGLDLVRAEEKRRIAGLRGEPDRSFHRLDLAC